MTLYIVIKWCVALHRVDYDFFQAVRGKDNIAINGEEDGGMIGHSEGGISEPEEDEEEVRACWPTRCF